MLCKPYLQKLFNFAQVKTEWPEQAPFAKVETPYIYLSSLCGLLWANGLQVQDRRDFGPGNHRTLQLSERIHPQSQRISIRWLDRNLECPVITDHCPAGASVDAGYAGLAPTFGPNTHI